MKKVSNDEYKSIILSVLCKIDSICRENKLKYSLAYGTLLGAIRHEGFIPWDDDIDIVMFRDDYEKLMKIVSESKDLDLVAIDCRKVNSIYPYGKICDSRTWIDEKNFVKVEDYGAFVDVFPLDHLPENKFIKTVYSNFSRALMILLTHSARTGYEKSSSLVTNILRFIAFHIGKAFNPYHLARYIERLNVIFDKKNSSIVGIPWAHKGLSYPTDYYTNLQNHIFENSFFLVSKHFDSILKMSYGDYMTFPVLNEQKPKHQLSCYYKD